MIGGSTVSALVELMIAPIVLVVLVVPPQAGGGGAGWRTADMPYQVHLKACMLCR